MDAQSAVPNGGLTAIYNVPAPAKINWFLHVLGRRADGYHEIQTVFQFIDWCDWLDFERNDTGAIGREGGDDLPGDDLSVRAAQLLQSHTHCHFGVRIHLRKNIPMQAGLGGGSSDAASTLLALNQLWGLGLARTDLLRLARQLGADVPVFVFGRNAFAQGVGDQLTAVELPSWSMLVAWPGVGLSTAAIFASPTLTRNTPPVTISSFAEFVRLVRESAATGVSCAMGGLELGGLEFGRNDLQAVAQATLPQMAQAKSWMLERTGSGLVAMSGSGSAFFSPCSPASQDGVATAPKGWQVRECRALLQHPLVNWIDDC
jgi:4-diphosphocytidyl-2-C-methyl-D-erythritol kinase